MPELKQLCLSQKDRNYPAPGDFSVVKLLVRKEDVHDAVAFIQKVKNENIEEDKLMAMSNGVLRVLVSIIAIPDYFSGKLFWRILFSSFLF